MHALTRPQAGVGRLVAVLRRADLRERPVTSQPHGDWLVALGINSDNARTSGLGAIHRLALVVDQSLEGCPETRQQRHPVFFSAADRIQLVLELGGEVVVNVLGKVAAQKLGDGTTDIRRPKAPAVQKHVLAIEQGLDDAGIGTGSADAVFLQRFHQQGLGETRRRLGEVLIGDDGR